MAAGLDAPLKRSDTSLAPRGTLPKRYGAVAQLVERDNRTVEARGSIPLSSTAVITPCRKPTSWDFSRRIRFQRIVNLANYQ